MNSFVYVPIVASLLVPVLCRLASTRLWPRAAAWTISGAASISAISTVGALVLLASPLPARVPWIATLGRWQPGAVEVRSPVPMLVSVLAMAALAALATRAVRELRALARELRDAMRLSAAIDRTRPGDVVVVVDDALPHAHAVGLGLTGRGDVIVSSSMLALLDDDERAAMIAHERAHLRERHVLFLAAARIAAAMNPLLLGLVDDVRFVLERSADEAAATATDRPIVASAVARAALAALDLARAPHPGFAFHPHHVSERVQAMLAEPDDRRRPSWTLIAVLAAVTLALAWAAHDTERFFEAARALSRR